MLSIIPISTLEILVDSIVRFFSGVDARNPNYLYSVKNYIESDDFQKITKQYKCTISFVLIVINSLIKKGVITKLGIMPDRYIDVMGLGTFYRTVLKYNTLIPRGKGWICSILGLKYAIYLFEKYVIHITGISLPNSKNVNRVRNGSGLLINDNTILTCAHVINEMNIDENVNIYDNPVKILNFQTDNETDVGIIKLSESVPFEENIVFGKADILDEIVTMGFPPIQTSDDAYMLYQKGEINSCIKTYMEAKEEYYVYSAISRPGNSGGPVFSEHGLLVGMTVRTGESQDSKDAPFHMCLTAKEIVSALKRIDPNISLKEYFP